MDFIRCLTNDFERGPHFLERFDFTRGVLGYIVSPCIFVVLWFCDFGFVVFMLLWLYHSFPHGCIRTEGCVDMF